jgi:hypothetical protein
LATFLLAASTCQVSGSFAGQQWIALGVLIAIAAAVYTLRHLTTKGRGLLIGADNRASTSETVAAAWTAAVAYMVIAVILISWTAKDSNCYLSTTLNNTDLLYLVFLGGPYSAAVLAKISVTTSLNKGTGLKSINTGKPTALDVIADDTGSTDLYDFQNTLFNVIAIIATVGLFTKVPAAGLPAVPNFLAALSGGAALAYTINKVGATLSAPAPVMDQIDPLPITPADPFTITGQNFYSGIALNATPIGDPPTITINASTAGGICKLLSSSNTNLHATLPAAFSNQRDAVVADLTIIRSDRATTTKQVTVKP